MVALYILLGLALLICAVLYFPFTVVLKYKDDLNVYLKILFFRINFSDKSDIKGEGEKKSAKSKKKKKKKKEQKPKKKKTISDILDILSLVKLLLKKFFKYLRIKVARFNIKVATGDPATAAIAYGAVNSALSALYPLLERAKTVKGVKSAEINVTCDFLSDKPEADIMLSFTLRTWHAISILLSAIVSYAKNIAKKDKKASNNETQKN